MNIVIVGPVRPSTQQPLRIANGWSLWLRGPALTGLRSLVMDILITMPGTPEEAVDQARERQRPSQYAFHFEILDSRIRVYRHGFLLLSTSWKLPLCVAPNT